MYSGIAVAVKTLPAGPTLNTVNRHPPPTSVRTRKLTNSECRPLVASTNHPKTALRSEIRSLLT